ncbi:MAG: recombinase family protein [Firmicutes bacterium]|nr:recombinase family protein [Bacillota bacterium]
MRAAVYCRVSTEEQATEGMSIPAQVKALHDFARKNSMEITDTFVDEGASARTADRPQFQRMIAMAKKKPRPFDVILIHKTDRFARNREDAVVYKSLLRRECGIEVISVTEQFDNTPTGKLLEGIMEVMAEFYSLNLSQEVKKGMKEKASRGGKGLGRMPVGYRLNADGSIVIVPQEAELVRFIFNTYTRGNEGLLSIARSLNSPEGRARFGEAAARFKWSSIGVRNIIQNPMYIGKMVWNRRDSNQGGRFRHQHEWITVDNSHEAIIDVDTFERANKILRSRRGGSHTPRVPDYLLKGMVRCMECGGALTYMSGVWRRKNGELARNPQLSCSRYHHSQLCYFNHVFMSKIEHALFDHLRELLNGRVDSLDVLIVPTTDDHTDKQRDFLRRRLEQVKVKFQRQMEAFESGAISLTELKEARQRVEAERQSIEQQLASLDANNRESPGHKLVELRQRIRDVLSRADDPALSPADRRRALLTIIDHLEYSRRQDCLKVVFRL